MTISLTDKERLECDLDFVFMLSIPNYIEFLIKNCYIQKQEFINYIQYLQYLTTPKYIHLVLSPLSLFWLQYLNMPQFREQLTYNSRLENISSEQIYLIYKAEQIQWYYFEREIFQKLQKKRGSKHVYEQINEQLHK